LVYRFEIGKPKIKTLVDAGYIRSWSAFLRTFSSDFWPEKSLLKIANCYFLTQLEILIQMIYNLIENKISLIFGISGALKWDTFAFS